ncbi:20S proteasome subunit [Pisolithus sp. B1]|nr:20S proteasome subunit [Pisolithus sp. B1]
MAGYTKLVHRAAGLRQYAFKAITGSGHTIVSEGMSVVITPKEVTLIDASLITHLHTITDYRMCDDRVETAGWRYKYCYEITPDALTRLMEDINEVYTQQAGMRINGLHLCPPFPLAMDPEHGLQCSKCDPAGYFVGFHATTAGGKQEAMNHPEEKWKKSDNGKSADNPAVASIALSHDEVIEAVSATPATDYELEEVEMGIISISEGENPETRGLHHLLACAEKDSYEWFK